MTEEQFKLGFNPKTKVKKTFIMVMTPFLAQFILDHHNKTNRKMVQAQINAINKSYGVHKWLWDGGVLVFNTDGNIMEFQHRLKVIVLNQLTVEVVVITGVEPDCFVKAAPAKNRTPFDAIYKVDKTVTADEVTTLRQVLKRRAGEGVTKLNEEPLTMTNAVKQWNEWKTFIRSGMTLSKSLFEDKKVTVFNPWQRQFNAWATLCIRTETEDLADKFMKMMYAHVLGKKETQLCKEFLSFFQDPSVSMAAGEEKAKIVHMMLCKTTDRLIIAPDGDTQLDLTYGQCNHTFMVNKGTYRDFLGNPQGLLKAA